MWTQFDSLVQTASGFNVAEGEAYAAFVGDGSKPTPRALPMQALDHAAGYLLAFGINAALCKTITVRIEYVPTYTSSYSRGRYRRVAHGRSVFPWLLLVSGYVRWGVSTPRLRLAKAGPCRLQVFLRPMSCGH